MLTHKTYVVDAVETGVAKIDGDIDSTVDKVLGFQITTNREDLLWKRGYIGISIGGHEIRPEGTPAGLYMSSPAVDPNKRDFNIGELSLDGTNRRLICRFEDVDATGAAFSAYKVKVHLLVKLKDN